jgi:hypothetical protein
MRLVEQTRRRYRRPVCPLIKRRTDISNGKIPSAPTSKRKGNRIERQSRLKMDLKNNLDRRPDLQIGHDDPVGGRSRSLSLRSIELDYPGVEGTLRNHLRMPSMVC